MSQQQLTSETGTPAPPPLQPPGLRLFPAPAAGSRLEIQLRFHRYLVLFLTFAAYAAFHASRKPPSIVKSVLTAPINQTLPINSGQDVSQFSETGTGWAPFDSPGSLGELDLFFLLAYAIGMYFAGHIGERFDLRIFLTIGMVGSGICVILFGLGYFLDVHSFGYFAILQVLCGLFQSIGWPCVVAVVGNWCGVEQKGFIMGAWNSHTSVGNIIGSVIASSVLGFGWGWSFVLPGSLVLLLAVFIFLFLAVSPDYVGIHGLASQNIAEVVPPTPADPQGSETNAEEVPLNNPEGSVTADVQPKEEVVPPTSADSQGSGTNAEEVPLNNPEGSAAADVQPKEEVVPPTSADSQPSGMNAEEVPLNNPEGIAGAAGQPEGAVAIGFLGAWQLPDVKYYAICLFFSKLVAYTFLYWLPFYIRHTAVGGEHLSQKSAGNLSAVFDVGGAFGGILAGSISDQIEAPAVTSAVFLVLSMPILFLYSLFGSISMPTNILLLFASGFLVNGPYSLITTAVATDLGAQAALIGNPHALATVSAIMDGTGSLGAALGPLLAGYISHFGWTYVFYVLITSIFIALCCLINVVRRELRARIMLQQQGLNPAATS